MASETDTQSIGEKNSSQSQKDYIERKNKLNVSWEKTQITCKIEEVNQKIFPYKIFLSKYPNYTATLSMRNMSIIKKVCIFSAEFHKVSLSSLLLSHLLAIEWGIYVEIHLTTSTSTFWWRIGIPLCSYSRIYLSL